MFVEEKRWLTAEEFNDIYALCQFLPGPNIVNLALMIGDRFAGTRGALAALAGILCAPLVLVLTLAVAAQQMQHWPLVAGALRGMGVVAAGLVVSTALKLAPGLRNNAMGPRCCAALALGTAVAVALLRWPLVVVVLVLGGAACAWAWVRVGAAGAGQ